MFPVLNRVWCSQSCKLDIHLLCLILYQITPNAIFIEQSCNDFRFYLLFFLNLIFDASLFVWAWGTIVVTFKSSVLNVQSVIFIETIIQTWAGREEVLYEANVTWWGTDHGSPSETVQWGPGHVTRAHLVTATLISSDGEIFRSDPRLGLVSGKLYQNYT